MVAAGEKEHTVDEGFYSIKFLCFCKCVLLPVVTNNCNGMIYLIFFCLLSI